MSGQHDVVFVSDAPEQTEALGRAMGEAAEDGDVLILVGDLAAGKTVFVRGLAAGLGADSAVVHSPTFALLHTYQGRISLHHFDLYRLEDPAELERLGFLDIFAAGAGVAAVEWGAKFAAQMPAEAVCLALAQPAGQLGRRVITMHAEQPGLPTFARLSQAARQALPQLALHQQQDG